MVTQTKKFTDKEWSELGLVTQAYISIYSSGKDRKITDSSIGSVSSQDPASKF